MMDNARTWLQVKLKIDRLYIFIFLFFSKIPRKPNIGIW